LKVKVNLDVFKREHPSLRDTPLKKGKIPLEYFVSQINKRRE